MAREVLGRLVSATGWLVIEDPGGDEPRARGFATRHYLGMHVLRMRPGSWFVTVEGDGADRVFTIGADPALPVPVLAHADDLVVSSNRFVIAAVEAYTSDVHDAVVAGRFDVARRPGVVLIEGWARPRSRLRWDRSPDTCFVRIEPP